MTREIPNCPHCSTNTKPERLGTASVQGVILVLWLCPVCSKTFSREQG